MKRFASTRSENRASQPGRGRAQWSVGSIDDDGIRYGLTTQALIASTIAIAPTIVTIQSTAMRSRRGRRPVTRSSGWWNSCCRCRDRPCRVAEPATRRAAQEAAAARTPPASASRRRAGRPSGSGAPGVGVVPLLACRSRDRSHVLAAPGVDPAVVAGEQDLGNRPPAELGRPRVVRVLEPAVERGGEALDLARPFAQRARQAARDGSRRARARGSRRPRARTGRSRRRPSQRWSRMRWSKPSNRAESSVSAGLGRELLDELLVELPPLRGERDHAMLGKLRRRPRRTQPRRRRRAAPSQAHRRTDRRRPGRRQRCRVAVVEDAKLELGAEDSRQRTALAYPLEGVGNEREDVEAHDAEP